eukprot:gene15568-21021_t
MLTKESFHKTPRCDYYKNLLNQLASTIPAYTMPIYHPDQVKNDSKDLISSSIDPFVFVGDPNLIKLILPDKSSSLSDIAQEVGLKHPIKIIEVGHQHEISGYTLGEYAEYLENHNSNHMILNMISLEVSASGLSKKVMGPDCVQSIDWIDIIWPLDRRRKGDYPRVQKYCLAGMSGSYTDFHIDFGGTSVWYHILHGKKRFYLIPPTYENLMIYKEWTCSANQSETFLGSLVQPGQCYQYDLNPNETLIIPSGWIHSVYTPEDSLVFGGNFLHAGALVRQLQSHYIETVTRVGKAYQFPYFKQINWYFLCHILTEDNSEDNSIYIDIAKKPYILYQLPYLIKSAEDWVIETKSNAADIKQLRMISMSTIADENLTNILGRCWLLLDNIAQKEENVENRNHLINHIHRIKQLKGLNLLKEEHMKDAFHGFSMISYDDFIINHDYNINGNNDNVNNNNINDNYNSQDNIINSNDKNNFYNNEFVINEVTDSQVDDYNNDIADVRFMNGNNDDNTDQLKEQILNNYNNNNYNNSNNDNNNNDNNILTNLASYQVDLINIQPDVQRNVNQEKEIIEVDVKNDDANNSENAFNLQLISPQTKIDESNAIIHMQFTGDFENDFINSTS